MKYNFLANNSLFIEVGTFSNYGGWVLDTQFIPNIGSAYLLAHGLGRPVADAETNVIFPRIGKYHVWVLTRDWISPWKEGAACGLFEVHVNGIPLTNIFGNEGLEWHWQYGGEIKIIDKEASITLHDLTGFEGRLAGLFFTMDNNFTPPNQGMELEKFRRELCNNTSEEYDGKFDLVVAGGGIAGICAALSAARSGLRVAFIQDRPVVGGNNSSEVRVWLGGETNFEPYKNIGNIVRELEQKLKFHYGKDNIGEIYEDDKKLKLLTDEENITLFMEHFLINCETVDSIIKSVSLLNVKNGSYKRIEADLFVDATGDATLGYVSGADYEMSTNGHMGMTNIWYIEDTKKAEKFPQCPWAIDLSKVQFPGRGNTKSVYNQVRETAFGGWYWESGCEHDPIEKAEYIRDTNLRAMYGAWDCVKNIDGDYKNYRLGNCTYIAGKRESRRLLGDIILSKSDVIKSIRFSDGCVPSTWNFDVHYPDRKFYEAFHEGDAFLSFDYHEHFTKPYFIPYRCLYSRNIKNLFIAGRNVSVTHDALGTVRVMRTGGMMGEVIGKAAAICIKHKAMPRDIYERLLDVFINSISK